MLLLPYRN